MGKLFLVAVICIALAVGFATPHLVQASPGQETLLPDGAGELAQWDVTGTSNYEATSDQLDTTDIYTNIETEKDLMNIQNLPGSSGTIHSVTIWFRGQVSPVGGGIPERAATYIRTSADNYFQGADNNLVDTPNWGDFSEEYTTNPQTLSAWTWAEVDALQAGVITVTQDTDEIIHVSEVWVVVDCTVWSTWNSYYNDYSTSCEDYNTGTSYIIYMKGTGFETGTYDVSYYDAGATQVGTDASIFIEAPADLQSSMPCYTDPLAAAGIWNATVYRNSDDALIADDTFYVNANVIPEFPTTMAAIGVAGLCFGIYWWMRKRRVGVCQGLKSSTSSRWLS